MSCLIPTNQNIINQIHYKKDGTIYSNNETINDELNRILNLNSINQGFKEQRKNALHAAYKQIKHKNPEDTTYTKSEIEKIIHIYEKFDEDGRKAVYAGYVVYMLNKRLR